MEFLNLSQKIVAVALPPVYVMDVNGYGCQQLQHPQPTCIPEQYNITSGGSQFFMFDSGPGSRPYFDVYQWQELGIGGWILSLVC